jgi:hypothetical protein
MIIDDHYSHANPPTFIIPDEASRLLIRQGGQVDIVRVKVMTRPRLLADLITAAFDPRTLLPWAPGEDPPLVTITNADAEPPTDSRLTILLGDRLDDPVSVVIDGRRSTVAPRRPEELAGLVLELAHGLRPNSASRHQAVDAAGADGGSTTGSRG